MNDLDLCLEVVSRSCQPWRYIRRWISRRPLKIEAWFQKTNNRKWHMGYQMVTWPMTSRDPQRCCEAVRSAILATAWLLVCYSWMFSPLLPTDRDLSPCGVVRHGQHMQDLPRTTQTSSLTPNLRSASAADQSICPVASRWHRTVVTTTPHITYGPAYDE